MAISKPGVSKDYYKGVPYYEDFPFKKTIEYTRLYPDVCSRCFNYPFNCNSCELSSWSYWEWKDKYKKYGYEFIDEGYLDEGSLNDLSPEPISEPEHKLKLSPEPISEPEHKLKPILKSEIYPEPISEPEHKPELTPIPKRKVLWK